MLPESKQAPGCTRRMLNQLKDITPTSLLKKVPAVSSAAVETLQFYTGLQYMQYLNDDLLGFIPSGTPAPELCAAFYFAQAVYYYSSRSEKGLKNICRIWNNEKFSQWDQLSCGESIVANAASFAFNGYAWFSTVNQTAFFLYKQSWNLGKPASFVMGAVTCTSNLLMETLTSHLIMRSSFSATRRAFDKAEKHLRLREKDFYKNATTEFQKAFDKFWKKFSIEMKIALQKPENKDYIQDPKYLADMLRLCIQSNRDQMENNLVRIFKLSPKDAEKFATSLSAIRSGNMTAETENNGVCYKVSNAVNTAVELTLKGCGGAQATFESYASAASIFPALLGVTDNWLVLMLFIASFTNGACDMVFYGNDACDSLTQFRHTVRKGDYDRKDIMMFLPSVFIAAITAHAAFSLLVGMAGEDEIALPEPLPPALPDWLGIALGMGAALRTFIIDTHANYDVLLKLVNWVTGEKPAENGMALEGRPMMAVDHLPDLGVEEKDPEVLIIKDVDPAVSSRFNQVKNYVLNRSWLPVLWSRGTATVTPTTGDNLLGVRVIPNYTAGGQRR